jgi:hypothetical protein
VVVVEPVVLEPVALMLLTLFMLPVPVELAVESEVVPVLGDVVTAEVFDAAAFDAVVFEAAAFDAAVVLVMVDVLPIVFMEVVGSSASVSDELHWESANGRATRPNGTTKVFKFIAAVRYGGDRAPTSRPLLFFAQKLERTSTGATGFEPGCNVRRWACPSYPRILCLAIA